MLLRNLKIVTPSKVIEDGFLSIIEGKIQGMGDKKDYDTWITSAHNIEHLNQSEAIDLEGLTVLPGFIDIHIHGSKGYDTMDAVKIGAKAITKIAESIIKSGVTSFLATTVSADRESIEAVVKGVEAAQKDFLSNRGIISEVLGIHLEGPFINPLAKGAQNEEFIQKPDLELLESFGETVKIITLAPEEDEDFHLTKKAIERGIIVSAGHTKAKYQEVMKAFEAGVAGVTHLFNGMTPLHHRDPGVAGAALEDCLVYVEIIADLIHLHPSILRLVKKTKGSKQIMLVTDGMRGQGMEPGEYELGGLTVLVDQGSARLKDGTLAGSVLTMDKALLNMKNETDASLMELADMTSGNQARILKLHDRGTIEIGKKADFVFLDEKLMVQKVMKNGSFDI